MKTRTCVCEGYTGYIKVFTVSDKQAIKRCQIELYNTGDKKKAKQMVEENPPDCRIE